MKNKIVSFKVAKVIKEAGYPQYSGENYWWKEGSYLSEHTEPLVEIYKGDDYYDYRQYLYYAPTYLDVWLWLWREKRIEIEVYGEVNLVLKNGYELLRDVSWEYVESNPDPEEAIIEAIEYLVDNNLLK